MTVLTNANTPQVVIPVLTFTYFSNQAIVSWPLTVTGWTLQTNESLTAGTWGDYLDTILNNSVTNSLTTGNLFFRLKHP
ncbi:MAG: hypothetical protein WDN00_17470 [Limisphaerales bacterium]